MDGGTARLPQLIGLSRALDLILTGRPIKADEALQLGVANRVAKAGTGGMKTKTSISWKLNDCPCNGSFTLREKDWSTDSDSDPIPVVGS